MNRDVKKAVATTIAHRTLKAERAVLDAVHRRHRRYAELQQFYSGAALVFAGLILAAIYGLLSHSIHA